MMVHKHDTVIMLVYSAIKNIANLKLAYSVWKPATSSDSASGKSNGTRLVSATAETKKQKNPKSCGQMFHPAIPHSGWGAWASIIFFKLKLPALRSTPTTAMVIASSYLITCAELRSPPRSGYLLLEDHPASATP